MKKLYKFGWYWGRGFDVTGMFVADEEDVKKAIGKHISFGEVCGKHSDMCGKLQEDDLEAISEDQEFLCKLVNVMGSSNISGYNPLEYLPMECEE